MKHKSIIRCVVLVASLFIACKKGNSGGDQAPPPPAPKKAIVSTFAGEGTGANLDGPLLSAKFYTPSDIAISANGTLYVADYNGRRIRKIAGGQVSVLAGDGNFGPRDGAGDMARFVDPYRIEVGPDGYIYVMDQADYRVRRITPDGEVSTYVGSGVSGFKNGDIATALFRQGMGGITMDAQGAVYIDDTQNGRIRKISGGQVSTYAGKETKGFVDGDTSVAQFLNPNAILFDKQGNMYVADNGNYCIRKITPTGMVSRFSGMGTRGTTDGAAGTAQFQYIYDMVIDKDGNLFIGDDARIRKVSPAGEVSTIAGNTTAGYADGDGSVALFNYPAGLAIDVEGSLYVADANNNRIRKITFK